MLLKIAKEFSTAPGPRFTSEGDYSGEDFRNNVLLPKLKKAMADGVTLTVDLDGTAGYDTSFLEESFGGLIRIDGFRLSQLDAALRLKSDEEPNLLREIRSYMMDADKRPKIEN